MGKGKIAGQVAHAAVEAAESIRRYCPEWYYSSLDDGRSWYDAVQLKENELMLTDNKQLKKPIGGQYKT